MPTSDGVRFRLSPPHPLNEPGRCIHTKHTSIKAEEQMTRTTVQRTRSLRTIAAPLIAVVLVLTACGSDGPVEDPSIPNTLRGGSKDNAF
jgi:hypothetical protein